MMPRELEDLLEDGPYARREGAEERQEDACSGRALRATHPSGVREERDERPDPPDYEPDPDILDVKR